MMITHCDACDVMYYFSFKTLLYIIFNASQFLFKAIFNSVT